MIDQISQVMRLEHPSRQPMAPPGGRGQGGHVVALSVAALVLALTGIGTAVRGQDHAQRRLQQRMDDAARREAEVLVELADKAMAGRQVPRDFTLGWRHDFLKADPGTFVPFTVTVEDTSLDARHGLLYVRVIRREATSGRVRASDGEGSAAYAFDAVFPVELRGAEGRRRGRRISRGFAVPAGEYDVVVVLRERPEDLLDSGARGLKASVLETSLSVPDFWSGTLAMSTVMLADRIDLLPGPLEPDEAVERPYVIGQNDVRVSADSTFRKDRELILVFVIYNPAVSEARYFDLQVDYDLFYRIPAGSAAAGSSSGLAGRPAPRQKEQYVTRTKPQRFNPSVLGSAIDPAAGHPVMAGQGIPLSSFDEGEYRLAITVTDLVSRRMLTRDVTFRVAGS